MRTCPHCGRQIETRLATFDEIAGLVCRTFGLTRNELLSQRSARRVARPRQIVMFLARDYTRLSSTGIGRRLGGRDHTTVLYGWKRIEMLCAEDPEVAADIDALRHTIESRTPAALREAQVAYRRRALPDGGAVSGVAP